jgi:hypothetical protein
MHNDDDEDNNNNDDDDDDDDDNSDDDETTMTPPSSNHTITNINVAQTFLLAGVRVRMLVVEIGQIGVPGRAIYIWGLANVGDGGVELDFDAQLLLVVVQVPHQVLCIREHLLGVVPAQENVVLE